MDLETDALEQWRSRQTLHLQSHLPPFNAFSLINGAHFAADHVLDQLVHGQVGQRTRVHCLAIAKDGDVIADGA